MLQTNAPSWLAESVQYLTLVGSHANGTASKTSDIDVYGICCPPKNIVYPYLYDEIPGFDKPVRFEKFVVQEKVFDKKHDITVYSITNFFSLCVANNPNIIESLFTDVQHELYVTRIGRRIKDNRHLFLSKLLFKRFVGFAVQAASRAFNPNLVRAAEFEKKHYIKLQPGQHNSKDCVTIDGQQFIVGPMDQLIPLEHYERYKLVIDQKSTKLDTFRKYGYDVKEMYQAIRVLDQCRGLLTVGHIEYQTPFQTSLMSIRQGEFSKDAIRNRYQDLLTELDTAFASCTLPDVPDSKPVRELLVDILEEVWG